MFKPILGIFERVWNALWSQTKIQFTKISCKQSVGFISDIFCQPFWKKYHPKKGRNITGFLTTQASALSRLFPESFEIRPEVRGLAFAESFGLFDRFLLGRSLISSLHSIENERLRNQRTWNEQTFVYLPRHRFFICISLRYIFGGAHVYLGLNPFVFVQMFSLVSAYPTPKKDR